MDAELIALSGETHDRLAERRTDPAWLAATWAEPSTRVLVLGGSRMPVDETGLVWVPPDHAPAGTRVLLGSRGSVVSFAILADRSAAVDESWVGLRSVLLSLDGPDASFAAHAVGLAEWHAATRHCPRCGGTVAAHQEGHVLRCLDCSREQFPRTDPAVIMRIVDASDRILLGRHPEWPASRWSTLAGFVEPGESLEQAVRREVLEEVGVPVGEVTYFGSQPWPLPASLMLGFSGHALGTDIVVDGKEIEDARWFSRDDAAAAAADGSLLIPPGVSISRSLITSWYGAELPGAWT